MKTPLEQIYRLARYLLDNYRDVVGDDISNENAVDEAIRILEFHNKWYDRNF